MNRINILDVALANKIAAGEVVERPSSVVKELVENSIDAKASKIDIFIVDSGRTLIKIVDDGVGMSKDDAILSIKRHATSKIKITQDLFNIKTMGFRGEALSAISAVSNFVMITKEKDTDIATKMCVYNSQINSIEQTSRNTGTTIEVSSLFYNTPARLKYLKSDNIELASIIDVTNRLALANLNVSFSLYSNEKLIFKTSGKNDPLEVIGTIYGYNIAKNMVKIEAKTNDFKIEGYVSNIETSRANKYAISTFMNNRSIRNKFLQDAIIDGYHELLFENRYPYAYISITTDASLLDVNVHPTKQEIRVAKENDLKKLITTTIASTLRKSDMVINQEIKKDVFSQGFFDISPTSIVNESANNNYEASIHFDDVKTIELSYEIIGQIHGTYIIAQNNEGFILVDQHAAKERINYEKFKKLFYKEENEISLVIPEVIELPISEYKIIEDNIDLLKTCHIEADLFGTNTIKISRIPYYFERINLKVYIQEVINQIVTNKKIRKEDLLDYAIATASCKASIKGNTYLSNVEMESILSDLFSCEDPYTCPHGRPTMIKYSTYELTKFFKR